MKITKAGRWVLLGFNLVLATAILAQPGQAASVRGGDCWEGCMRSWAQCVIDGGWDCNYKVDRCLQTCIFTIWGLDVDPDCFPT